MASGYRILRFAVDFGYQILNEQKPDLATETSYYVVYFALFCWLRE
jgi:hypothetical protein